MNCVLTRVAEWITEDLSKAKSGSLGCAQGHELWSIQEEVQMRPGHHWLCEFGDAALMKVMGQVARTWEINLQHRTWEDQEGTRFYNGGRALVIKRWLSRVT